MAVMGVARFERFFRTADGLDVDREDIKRYEDFVNLKIYDLLIRGEANAIEHAVTLLGDDDLLVVFAEKVPSALATVRAHARTTS